MNKSKLGAIESKFADIIWENEPLSTAQLVKLCENEFSWKRTTTYTVLKRLSDYGLFVNNNSEVTSIVSKEEFYSNQCKTFVSENFDGSLPAFLAAFTKSKALSQNDIDEIKKMIDSYEEEKK